LLVRSKSRAVALPSIVLKPNLFEDFTVSCVSLHGQRQWWKIYDADNFDVGARVHKKVTVDGAAGSAAPS